MYDIQETKIRGEHFFKACFTGVFDRELVFKFIDEMADLEEKQPGNKLLVDFTAVTDVLIDYKDIKSIVQYVRENDKRIGKTAFATGPNQGKFMIAKLFVSLVNVFRPNQEKSFKYLTPAIAWLCPNNA